MSDGEIAFVVEDMLFVIDPELSINNIILGLAAFTPIYRGNCDIFRACAEALSKNSIKNSRRLGMIFSIDTL